MIGNNELERKNFACFNGRFDPHGFVANVKAVFKTGEATLPTFQFI